MDLVQALKALAARVRSDGGGGNVGLAFEYLPPLHGSSSSTASSSRSTSLALVELALGRKISQTAIEDIHLLSSSASSLGSDLAWILLTLANNSNNNNTRRTSSSTAATSQQHQLEAAHQRRSVEEEWWKGRAFRMVKSLNHPQPQPPLLMPPPTPPSATIITTATRPRDAHLSLSNPIRCIADMCKVINTCVQIADNLPFPLRLQNTTQRCMQQLAREQRGEVVRWLECEWPTTYAARMMPLERFARNKLTELRALQLVFTFKEDEEGFAALADHLHRLIQSYASNATVVAFASPLLALAKRAIEADVFVSFFRSVVVVEEEEVETIVSLSLPHCMGGKVMSERCGRAKVLTLKYALEEGEEEADGDLSLEEYCQRCEQRALELCREYTLHTAIPRLKRVLLSGEAAAEGEEDDLVVVQQLTWLVARLRQLRQRFQLVCYERFHFYHALEVHVRNRLAWDVFPEMEAMATTTLDSTSVWQVEHIVQDRLQALWNEPWNSPMLLHQRLLNGGGVPPSLESFRESRNLFVRFLSKLASSSSAPAGRVLMALDCNGFHLAAAAAAASSQAM